MLMIAAAFWPFWNPAPGTIAASTKSSTLAPATAAARLTTTTRGGDT